MPPKNLKSGAAPFAGVEAIYTAAAVFGGNATFGSMKTVRWLNFVGGRL